MEIFPDGHGIHEAGTLRQIDGNSLGREYDGGIPTNTLTSGGETREASESVPRIESITTRSNTDGNLSPEGVGKEHVGGASAGGNGLYNQVGDKKVGEHQAPAFLVEKNIERLNFSSIGTDQVVYGGEKNRYKNNTRAIKLLKTIESENRLANREEQGVLSLYVGWGGLSQAFNQNAEHWAEEYRELKELLTDSEYESARASTTTAFFTSNDMIGGMYRALGNFGLQKANILEPACAIGNFFGMLPDSMRGSNLFGVEIDDISGRIAKQLYQKADIKVMGFEKAPIEDNFFDAVIGNVPFGDFKVNDIGYDKHNLLIHDYFILKSLDKVRPNGIVALITSKGTLDKENSAARKLFAQRADLLGAVRLPSNSFKKIAGTEVTSDILIFQKRERLLMDNQEIENLLWIKTGLNENDISINNYYVENPHMMLGTMIMDSGMYGEESKLISDNITELDSQIKEAVDKINLIRPLETFEIEIEKDETTLPATPDVKNYSYTLIENDIYYRINSKMIKSEFSSQDYNKLEAYMSIRETTKGLIQAQLKGCSEEELKEHQEKLHHVYNGFNKTYGTLGKRDNKKLLDRDAEYPLVCSLEVMDKENNIKKADIFFMQTINPIIQITEVDTAVDALTVSLDKYGRVDLEYMASLYKANVDELIGELSDIIYLNPIEENQSNPYVGYEVASEYLSGNIRKKLEIAKELNVDGKYNKNIMALENVLPKDLDASEIDVKIGTPWIDIKDYQDFIYNLLETPRYLRNNEVAYNNHNTIQIFYNNFTGAFTISNKTKDSNNVLSKTTYGTSRVNAYEIFESSLNLNAVTVRDRIEDGKNVRYVVNKQETMFAREKQEAVKEEFREWVFSDADRRKKYVDYYNNTYNSVRLREYDGSHLTFPGKNPNKILRTHQANAIARTLYGGNTLLAHTVGAGKTYVMTAAAMEARRLGLANKPLLVVPNHITEQFASEFLNLYPAANVLVARKKDFETHNRKQFVSKIATGDYDAVIIGHSQFERIPISADRQEKQMRSQVWEITAAIEKEKRENSNSTSLSVKQLELTKKRLEQKIEKLLASDKKDDVITFEELGVDRVFVDEAHYYKHCAVFSKMTNVAGINQTSSQKAMDMLFKVDYINEITDEKGIIFATGTPISNSMTEMYVMQRYLQPSALKEKGVFHFDQWAAQFGETVTALELAPEGSGYRFKTRFSKFVNLPELMNMFKETADIQTADILNLPVPKLRNDKYEIITSEPNDFIMDMMGTFAERAKSIRDGRVDPSDDNMLKLTLEARLLGTDARLFNKNAPNDEDSKINRCAQLVNEIYNNTSEKKGTQIIFSDIGTPSDNPDKFTVYGELVSLLKEKGIPSEQICVIHDAKTELQKQAMFKDLLEGKKRIIIGSTPKMGTGTNIQDRLVALHHIDCPYRPSDIEQREGRILRQGNLNKEVDIVRYVTKNTFDAYLWQIVENKQRFISQVMTSKVILRSCDDIDEAVLSYAELKAIASGNPLIKEKIEIDNDISKLQMLKTGYRKEQYKLQDDININIPKAIKLTEEKISNIKEDTELVKNMAAEFAMIIKGRTFDERKKAGEFLHGFGKEVTANINKEFEIGSMHGFAVSLKYDAWHNKINAILHNKHKYTIELEESPVGSIVRLENAIDSIPKLLQAEEIKLEAHITNLINSKKAFGVPFPKEDELQRKLKRQTELNGELEIKVENVISTEPGTDQNERDVAKDMKFCMS